MKKILKVLAGLGLLALSFGLVGFGGKEIPGTSNSGVGCGSRMPVGKAFTVDSECHPIVVFYNNPANWGVGILYSQDLGETWSQPVPVVEYPDSCFSAALAADSSGNVYMGYVFYSQGLFFMASTDGGKSWSQPRIILNRDSSSAVPYASELGYGNGRLYLTWIDNREDNNQLYMITSDDRGQTWSEENHLWPDTSYVLSASLAVKGSELGILRTDFCHTHYGEPDDELVYRLSFNTSTDGGTTWEPTFYPIGEEYVNVPNLVHFDLELGEDAYYATWDSANTVYFAYSLDNGENWNKEIIYTADTSIWGNAWRAELAARDDLVAVLICADTQTILQYSTNHGVQWSSPISLGGNHYGTSFPRLEIDNGNRIHALWQQRVTIGDDYALFYFCETSLSSDDHKSFKLSPTLSALPNPFSGKVMLQIYLDSKLSIKPCIYDASGRLVRSFGAINPGKATVFLTWDGRDDEGRRISAGSYYLKVRRESGVQSLKIVKVE